jgi:tight adherence protein C
LRELSARVNHSDLSSVINAIIQAEELGVSIGELLRIQGDMLRNKRFTLAEKLANEAPVKIILPIVIFIFPAVLIILIGPIAMQAVNMF